MLKKLALGTIISVTVTANADQWEPVINMAVEQLKQSGESGVVSGCLGVSESKFIKEYRPMLKSCLSKHGISGDEAAMDQCFVDEIVSRFGTPESKVLSCKEQIAETEEEQEEIDFSNLTDEEAQALIAKQQQQAMKEMEAMVQASKAASKGTEHLITLPVYAQSEIVAHYSMGMSFDDGKFSLPVATFSSGDSVNAIVEFYKQKLPNFQSKDYGDGLVIFMEKIPENFEPLRDMETYQNTPHVAIYTVGAGDSKALQTTIEIAYSKS